jgi:hypothetical protein
MRTNAAAFGKRTPLTEEHFADFEKCFGSDPFGKSKRKDQGEKGRFRKLTRGRSRRHPGRRRSSRIGGEAVSGRLRDFAVVDVLG